jgi:hypothetical protein
VSLSRTPKGTVHERVVRKSPIGRRVPVTHVPAPSWHDIYAFRDNTAGAHRNPEHPSRKHDVAKPEPVRLPNPEPQVGIGAVLRRRDRRSLRRIAIKMGLT